MERARALSKSGRTAEAKRLRHAYYHSEVLEFADWVQINEEEIKLRY